MDFFSLPRLTESAVRHGLIAKSAEDCRTTAELLAFLAEFEARRLYVVDGYSSMYAYCLGRLHYSEDTAGRRLDAARTARKFPAIFVAVAEGRIHLSGVLMLVDHLTAESVDELVAAATHKSKSEIALMLAHRYPKPDVLTTIVAVPAPGFPNELNMSDPSIVKVSPAPVRVTLAANRPVPITPTAPGRYRLELMLSQSTYELLTRAQDLLGHQVPSGDVDRVLHHALGTLVAKLEGRKFAATERPRAARQSSSSNRRHIPAEVRRAIRERDGGRCTFVSDNGHRCESRRVEFDHVEPVARGGTATVANIRLRCRTHNQYAAECAFGAGFMEHKRNEARCRAAEAQAAKVAREQAAEERARADAETRALAEARERAAEVVPFLRGLGFRADEANRAAALCESIPDAPIEMRVRVALRSLAPRCVKVDYGSSSPA